MKLILTGKCKQDFEKWYNSLFFKLGKKRMIHWDVFYNDLSPSMQHGVYVDFFDSIENPAVEIFTTASYLRHENYFSVVGWKEAPHEREITNFKTRPEARIESIKQADIMYNNPSPRFNSPQQL